MKTTEMPVYIQKCCFTDLKADMYTEGCGSTYRTVASVFHIDVMKGQVSSPRSLLCSHFILRKQHLFWDEHPPPTHTPLYFMSHIQPVSTQARDKEICHWQETMDEGTLGNQKWLAHTGSRLLGISHNVEFGAEGYRGAFRARISL